MAIDRKPALDKLLVLAERPLEPVLDKLVVGDVHSKCRMPDFPSRFVRESERVCRDTDV